jgi:His/Glu/Gln/Arg/opine family amino acid ABC transporter permease subunit
MDYRWHWGVLLQPVATGEPATYLDWLFSGLVNTVELTLLAFSLALAMGTVFGVMRTLPNRAANAASAVYVSIFRGVPLIVQFFIWFFVVPELLPSAAGDWFKSAHRLERRAALRHADHVADYRCRDSLWLSMGHGTRGIQFVGESRTAAFYASLCVAIPIDSARHAVAVVLSDRAATAEGAFQSSVHGRLAARFGTDCVFIT